MGNKKNSKRKYRESRTLSSIHKRRARNFWAEKRTAAAAAAAALQTAQEADGGEAAPQAAQEAEGGEAAPQEAQNAETAGTSFPFNRGEYLWPVTKLPKVVTQITALSEGFIKVKCPTDNTKEFLQFRGTKSFDEIVGGDFEWPSIYFGNDSPFPRWTLVPLADAPEGKDLEHQLITTFDMRTHIPGLARGSHPKSYDANLGLGALDWRFECGPESGWKGLSQAQLYEFAFRSLIESLYNYFCCNDMRAWIRRQKWAHVANVDDPLPPPRHPPETTSFGQAAGESPGAYTPCLLQLTMKVKGQFFTRCHDHYRPKLAISLSSQPQNKDIDKPMVKKPLHRLHQVLLRNRKCTLRSEGEICRSLDPRR